MEPYQHREAEKQRDNGRDKHASRVRAPGYTQHREDCR
jgi:hypothetical protein